MTKCLLIAALALLMAGGVAIAHAEDMPINADDPWAKAIGDTRTLERDHIGCTTKDDVDFVGAIQRNTIGLSAEMPAGCTFFPRGSQVVVVKLEYGGCGTICARIHRVVGVGDQRRYWMDAPVELFEAK
jgi:hypothetical protein